MKKIYEKCIIEFKCFLLEEDLRCAGWGNMTGISGVSMVYYLRIRILIDEGVNRSCHYCMLFYWV